MPYVSGKDVDLSKISLNLSRDKREITANKMK